MAQLRAAATHSARAGLVGELLPRLMLCAKPGATETTRSVRTCPARTLRVFVAGIDGNVGRRRRHQAAGGGVQWLRFKTISVPVSLLQRRPCIRPYLCAQIQRAQVPLHGRHEHSAWINRLVPPALLALYCMPGLRCCFAECIAMCAWRAHVCTLFCGVLLMLACSCRF